MSNEELHDEMLRLDKQIRMTTWSALKAGEKDAWIAHFETMLTLMRDDRDGVCRWLGQVNWQIRPGLPLPLVEHDRPRPIAIDLEHREVISSADPHAVLAPIEPGAAVVVPSAPGDVAESAVPPRVQTGIGFDAVTGQAIAIFGDDEDLTL